MGPADPQAQPGGEALAALANGIFLAAASGAILWEAAHRLGAPPDV